MSHGTINKMLIIGYVGQAPVYKKTEMFTVCNISIATNEKIKEEKITEWHKCVFYNKLADIVHDYVKKGDKIFVEGKVKTRKWTDKEGKEHTVNEIIANEMTILAASKHESLNEDKIETTDFSEDIPF